MSWTKHVRGHQAVLDSFRRAIRAGRLAHGYLFTGDTGIGKRLFATELARAMLCENPPTFLEACDECPSCVQIDAGTHPDFLSVARPPEVSEFPVLLMRETCASFAMKSARGKGKVVIIDDVDDLNEESANCFLKTLEEPPPRSLIILVGSSPDRQLPTIVSRCQVIRFAPLSDDDMRLILRERLSADEGGNLDAMLKRLVRMGRGSPGLALSLSDDHLWSFRKKLLKELTNKPLNGVDASKNWMEYLDEVSKEGPVQRRQAMLVLRLTIDFFSDALALHQGGAPHRTDSEDLTLLEPFAKRLGDPEALLSVLDRCLEADDQLRRTTPVGLVVEGLLDSLAQKLV